MMKKYLLCNIIIIIAILSLVIATTTDCGEEEAKFSSNRKQQQQRRNTAGAAVEEEEEEKVEYESLEDSSSYYFPADYKNSFIGHWRAPDPIDGSLLNLFISCEHQSCYITIQDDKWSKCLTGMGSLHGNGYVFGDILDAFLKFTCFDEYGYPQDMGSLKATYMVDKKNPNLLRQEDAFGLTVRYFKISTDCTLK